MSKAIATPTTAGASAPVSTRRQILGGTVLAALTGGAFGAAVVLPNPGHASFEFTGEDAAVLAACAAFTTAQQEVERLEHVDAPDDVFEAAVSVMRDASIRVSGLRAITPAGLRAKGHVCREVLAIEAPRAAEGRFDIRVDRHDVLAASFLADFLGAPAAPAPARVAASPDAALLADCVAFDALEAAYRATDFNAATNSPEALVADAEQNRITAAQLPLVNRMVDHQAVTRAGQVARARSLAAWKPELLGDGPAEDIGECLMSAIVRDLVQAA